MHFKDRRTRRRDQSGYEHQISDRLNKQKENDTENWFQYYETNCRNSQWRQQGDFQRINHTHNQQTVKDDRITTKSQMLKKMKSPQEEQRSSQHFQISLKSSRPQELIKSKLEQTKDEISQQLNVLERRFNKTLQEDHDLVEQYVERQNYQIQQIHDKVSKSNLQIHECFNDVVNQLNKAIEMQNKKITKTDAKYKKIVEDLKYELKAEISQSVIDLEEKIERFTVNSDNIKKSKSMIDYSVELKSSINDIGINNGEMSAHYSGEEMRIKEIQQLIKSMKLQILEIKAYTQTQETKNPSSEQTIERSQVEKQLQYLREKLKGVEDDNQQKRMELFRITQIQEQNIKEMNDEFTKVINTQMLPRLKTLEDDFKAYNNKLQQRIEQNYTQKIQEKMGKMTIINVRQTKQSEKEKLGIRGGIGYKQTYMLDENGYLLDSSGTYLLGQDNQRIKIEQDQLYYLKVEGIQIKS